jgi:hypothetical protein
MAVLDRSWAARFSGSSSAKRTGGFRPDPVTLDRHRVQNRMFGCAPIVAVHPRPGSISKADAAANVAD